MIIEIPERERGRETDREREGGRETDREREGGRETERERGREGDRQREWRFAGVLYADDLVSYDGSGESLKMIGEYFAEV